MSKSRAHKPDTVIAAHGLIPLPQALRDENVARSTFYENRHRVAMTRVGGRLYVSPESIRALRRNEVAPLLTMRDLEDAGADAGNVLDATEWDLERGIAMAASPDDRRGLVQYLKAVRKLRAEWFA